MWPVVHFHTLFPLFYRLQFSVENKRLLRSSEDTQVWLALNSRQNIFTHNFKLTSNISAEADHQDS